MQFVRYLSHSASAVRYDIKITFPLESNDANDDSSNEDEDEEDNDEMIINDN